MSHSCPKADSRGLKNVIESMIRRSVFCFLKVDNANLAASGIQDAVIAPVSGGNMFQNWLT